MQKTICGKLYDTDAARIIKKYTEGTYGDPCGFEETLYLTEDGRYFFYTNGGEESKYPTESIKRASRATAEKWLSEN